MVSRQKKRKYTSLAPVLIFCVTLAVYANTFNNQFTNWDDVALIINNEQIRSLDLKNIIKIFDFSAHGTYQPVRVLSYAIDYHFWKLNPFGYHIHSILLHAFASVILYLGLLRIIPMIRGMEHKEPSVIQYTAFFTAFVFAVHPLCTEAVTWLSGRKYVLLSFFSFLSLYLFAGSFQAETGQVRRISGAVILAVFAAFSSPFGVILPVIVFICVFSWDKSNNPFSVFLKQKARLLPFCVVFIPVFLKLWTALVKIDPGGTGPGTGHFEGKAVYTFWTMFRVFFDYVRNIFFPFWLNIRYPDFVSKSFMEYKIIIVTAVIAVLGIIFLRCFKKDDKRIFFCIAWFVVFWLPVSNIIPISTKMADRYIYMAFPGLILLVSLYLFPLFNSTAKKYGVAVPLIAVLLVVCYFAPFTIARNRFWKDSGTLWRASLRTYPNNAIAHNNLGVHLLYLEKKPKEAEMHFKEAIRLKPESSQPYENLYDAFFLQKQYTNAARCAEKLALMQPDNGDNARWYNKAGTALEKLGDIILAEQYYKKALKEDPVYLEAVNSLGSLLISQKRYKQAEILFAKALSSGKINADLFFNLGVVFSLTQKPDQAVKYFLKAIEINPMDAVAHFLTGRQLLRLGKEKEANRYVNKARQLDPDNKKFY